VYAYNSLKNCNLFKIKIVTNKFILDQYLKKLIILKFEKVYKEINLLYVYSNILFVIERNINFFKQKIK